ncbi:ATP phosphoribosyltransferase regulatory subunit [Mesorhizobium sp. RP14(2022)]|uniref:ATP phosphoribosyltransferase regulatory subunit n=1 Tax=Mesorhizobium liriopis TaxID=2953882 RepID=A0ABT1C0T8_9HYPH|nr:ATP phosphoribosyltransferase regulatory subunit [Mesorhizobium liriopis]MCO6048444.1 ATP phosphoribosyltransferase regulatory subunit [Mesorhizobium liriopis]
MSALAAQVAAFLAARDAGAVDAAILQPAEPFLDMAGEDLRRRIFLTESETGETLCLRPEWTIPVCLDHIASQAGTPRRYSYCGEVFRQQRAGAVEFLQAGIEDLGETDTASADARSLADAHALVQTVLPDQSVAITLGDQAVFEEVLTALGLPRGWRRRLVRAFGSPDQLSAALEDIANPVKRGILAEEAGEQIAQSDEETIATLLRGEMESAGFSPSAGRTPEDIAHRLLEKASLASLRLPAAELRALRIFLSVKVSLERATDALYAFGRGAGITLDGAVEGFARRSDALREHGLTLAEIRYDAAFGRPLDYYTGLVFEIATADGERPLIGGGRYDRLLTLLGAADPIPGVGFSAWLDRIEAARGGAA